MKFLSIFLGFRKFAVIVMFMAVMITFRLLEMIDGKEFADNLQIGIVAYLGSNLGEHVINIGREYMDRKSSKKKEEGPKE